MVEIKTFIEVTNNVNKVRKGKGVVLIIQHINMAFAGFLPCHSGVLLGYHFYLHTHTVVILQQEAIVVQVNILQLCISKH